MIDLEGILVLYGNEHALMDTELVNRQTLAWDKGNQSSAPIYAAYLMGVCVFSVVVFVFCSDSVGLDRTLLERIYVTSLANWHRGSSFFLSVHTDTVCVASDLIPNQWKYSFFGS